MFRYNLISAFETRRAVGKIVGSHFVMSFLLCNGMSGMSVTLTHPRKQQPERLLLRLHWFYQENTPKPRHSHRCHRGFWIIAVVMKWGMHQGRMELFLKTIDEVRAAFQHRVKREHLGVICLISALLWLHPLLRSLLVLDVTSGRGWARACPPLGAHAAYVKGTGKVRGTFRDRPCEFLRVCARAQRKAGV